MKFQLVQADYGKESETDEQGNYSMNITLGLKADSDLIPPFSKDIEVVSNNSQTGYDVDAQRQKAIDEFMAKINN